MRMKSLESRLNVTSRMPLREAAPDDVDHRLRVAPSGVVEVDDVADTGLEETVVRGDRGEVLRQGWLARRSGCASRRSRRCRSRCPTGSGGSTVRRCPRSTASVARRPLRDRSRHGSARSSATGSWPYVPGCASRSINRFTASARPNTPNIAENRSSSRSPSCDEPAVLEEAGILDEIAQTGLDQLARELHEVWERLAEEVVEGAVVVAHDLQQVEPHEGVRAASDRQRVVATDRGVPLPQVAHHHRMVDEVRLAAGEDRAHAVEDEIVGRALRVDLQREVRDHLQQLTLQSQNGTGEGAVVGPEVGVDERVRQDPVERTPEGPKRGDEFVDIHPVGERRRSRSRLPRYTG